MNLFISLIGDFLVFLKLYFYNMCEHRFSILDFSCHFDLETLETYKSLRTEYRPKYTVFKMDPAARFEVSSRLLAQGFPENLIRTDNFHRHIFWIGCNEYCLDYYFTHSELFYEKLRKAQLWAVWVATLFFCVVEICVSLTCLYFKYKRPFYGFRHFWWRLF